MSRRTALIAALAVLGVAVVGVLLVRGGNEAGPKTTGRAIALANNADGKSFVLVERHDSTAVGPVEDDGGLDLHDTDAAVGQPAALAADHDALLVLGTRTVGTRREAALARVRPDGSVDPTFGVHPVGNGRTDTVARAVAATPTGPIVVTADTTQGNRHAIAVARIERTRGAASFVDLVPDAAAGAAVATPDGNVLVVGTDTRDGSLVRVLVPPSGDLEVVRAPTQLHGVTWRAVTITRHAGVAAVGDGRLDDGRSVLAVQRLDKGTKAELTAAAGSGDAYAAAVQFDPRGRLVIAANGTDGERPAAFVITFGTDGKPRGGRRPRALGRVAGLAPDGRLVTTRWDGERQVVASIPP